MDLQRLLAERGSELTTWHPFVSFGQSLKALEDSDLESQRLDCLLLLEVLNGASVQVLPAAVLNWDGYIEALVEYALEACQESIKRGLDHDTALANRIVGYSWGDKVVMPPWLTEDYCTQQRALLIRKNPEHYGPIFNRAEQANAKARS